MSDRIKRARLRAGFSARKLSRLAGLADGHVAMIERGHVDGSVVTIGRLARVLGVSIDWLVFGEHNAGPANSNDGEAA